ncbi:YncE family protein [Streptomyces sp. NPDC021080]|uniref:YncE family protein n=1 Tax=Streptomyces sp. NPDC021080 TaxID=3365110 RepID=UPI0037A295B4
MSLQGTDAIAVLEVGTLKVRRRLPLGAPPFGLALMPDGLRGYATARDVDFLLPFDTWVVSAPVPSRPEASAAHSDGRRVYVTASGADEALVVETDLLTVKGRILLPGAPHDVAVSRDGKTLVVTLPAAGCLAVVDTASGELVGTPIPTGKAPHGVTLAPDGGARPCDQHRVGHPVRRPLIHSGRPGALGQRSPERGPGGGPFEVGVHGRLEPVAGVHIVLPGPGRH